MILVPGSQLLTIDSVIFGFSYNGGGNDFKVLRIFSAAAESSDYPYPRVPLRSTLSYKGVTLTGLKYNNGRAKAREIILVHSKTPA